MRIIAQSKRVPKEVLCDTCGTIFECELTDPLIIKETDIYWDTLYYVICPTCMAKIPLGTNVNKIFPWGTVDPVSHGNETPQ